MVFHIEISFLNVWNLVFRSNFFVIGFELKISTRNYSLEAAYWHRNMVLLWVWSKKWTSPCCMIHRMRKSDLFVAKFVQNAFFGFKSEPIFGPCFSEIMKMTHFWMFITPSPVRNPISSFLTSKSRGLKTGGESTAALFRILAFLGFLKIRKFRTSATPFEGKRP